MTTSMINHLAQLWLNCEISKGMFSDEATVTVTTTNGERFATFVPLDKIIYSDQDRGIVNVGMFKKNNALFAVLPDEYHSIIAVSQSDICLEDK